jgi:hypothetical protein
MRKAILLPLTLLTMAACCFPALAAAGGIVPPGNSAANQYTETFPTSKGEEDAQGKKKSGVTPAQVLGAGKAHELEDKGAAGKAVANFAAETSPAVVDTSTSTEGGGGNGKPQNPGGGEKGEGGGKEPGAKEGGSQGTGGIGGGGQTPSGGSGAGAASAAGSGSSSLGEIASQATGTSSGSLGLWLPLILIAVVIWSAAYVLRNRQQRVV